MNYITKENLNQFLDYLLNSNLKEIDNRGENLIELKGDSIQYNLILEYIKDLSDGESKDRLYNNSKAYKETYNNELTEKTHKIIDYILLEVPRSKDFDRIRDQLKKSDEFLREGKKNSRKLNKVISNHESKMDKMQGEFISILSIFSAVIIAFFGGVNLLSSAFSNMGSASKYRFFFTILMVGFVMFNVIYMLLYSIAKLTGKSIAVKINMDSCTKCSKVYFTHFIKCISTKYPIVFIYNSCTLILCCLIFAMYIVDEYNFFTFIMSSIRLYKKETIPLVGGMIVLPILGIVWYKIKNKKITCSKDNDISL